jgi:hypothetical protein
VLPSLLRIASIYAVIAEPSFDGATQVIVTLTLMWPERCYSLILTSDESAPWPTSVLAENLKV